MKTGSSILVVFLSSLICFNVFVVSVVARDTVSLTKDENADEKFLFSKGAGFG
ncbi:hypothetical protein MKW94_003432, partial [Papaver nudicaule]|nr:hypothetical protein [Papaver nudicaule]